MEISDIIENSLKFPMDNLKPLGIYIGLYLLIAILVIFSIVGLISAVIISPSMVIVSVILLILALIVYFIIGGYQVEVIKTGVNHENIVPSIQFKETFILGIKAFIVAFIYMLIPIIIMSILFIATAGLSSLTSLTSTNPDVVLTGLGILIPIGIILFIIFSFIHFMANGRLAETDSLGYALNIPEAVRDISRIGVGKVIVTVLVLAIILIAVSGILHMIPFVGSVISIIVTPYLIFTLNRGNGLLYADVKE